MTQPLPPLDEAAQQLAQSADYRVLRRIPPVERWEFPAVTGFDANNVVRAAVVDCETTGLGDDDEVVELAIIWFEYDKVTGSVANAVRVFSGLRQPSKPIPESATAIHGITNEMVAGKVLDDADLARALEGVQLVIAHNAGFDRPMVERHWPLFEGVAWACSCDEVDWKGEGFGSRGLEYLLFRQGWFYETHRALDDAMALLWLLTQQLPSGRPVLGALLESARKPQYVVKVKGSLFDERDELKRRGYRWEAMTRTWWTTVNDARLEHAWLKAHMTWPDGFTVDVRKVQPTERYSRRLLTGSGT
jgi:DNA polymerase-3 subunit epsilon